LNKLIAQPALEQRRAERGGGNTHEFLFGFRFQGHSVEQI
jgi:hypothetical protein